MTQHVIMVMLPSRLTDLSENLFGDQVDPSVLRP